MDGVTRRRKDHRAAILAARADKHVTARQVGVHLRSHIEGC
jgi:hypothetical protein